MKFREWMSNADIITKVAIINLIILFSYVLLAHLLAPLFIPGDQTLVGGYRLSFRDEAHTDLNLTAIVGALVIGSIAAFVMQRFGNAPKKQQNIVNSSKPLSADERKMLDAIRENGEITQDSLKYRFNWSRAKVSALTTTLERLNFVQRRREGKTYVLFLSKRG